MQIRLKLMGVIKDKTPADGLLELPDGATIEDALVRLDIPVESVQTFTINGQLERDRNRTLTADDELTVLPPVGGG